MGSGSRFLTMHPPTGLFSWMFHSRFPPEYLCSGVLHIPQLLPYWPGSNIRNEESGSALASRLLGAAALPVDSHIKSYSLLGNTIIQAEAEQLRPWNTDEETNS